jgi:hypothetical protein
LHPKPSPLNLEPFARQKREELEEALDEEKAKNIKVEGELLKAQSKIALLQACS